MTCEILAGTGAVFSVWGKPARTDMDRILENLGDAASRAGAPVTYITRVPVDAPAPEADVRQYLDSLMPRVVDYCKTYHVILEGVGFLAAVKRSVLVGIFQVRWRNGTFFVHAGSNEVLEKVGTERRAGVEALLQQARTLGLLSNTPGLTSGAAGRAGERTENARHRSL
ncbi:MAG TPA: hypothetical protein VFQ35_09320 [Polyangiaceae bacterium]|nr:hypothetical protein [Polyangiaceae bacterium]